MTRSTKNIDGGWSTAINGSSFELELGAALNLVALLPGIGTPYELSPVPGVRRLYLDKIDCHLYYTYDDARVIIRSLWGARRGRGPSFGS